MVCCAADGICEEDEEGRERVGRPQRAGDKELESDDEEDNPLCQWLVSHQLRHLKFTKMRACERGRRRREWVSVLPLDVP